MNKSNDGFYQQKYKFIRWNYWIAQYDVAIYEAILLSLNLDPESIYYPERKWATELATSDRLALDERVEIIKTHIGKGKSIDCENKFLKCRINLKEFSLFLKSTHLPMPHVLESISNNDSNLMLVIDQYENDFRNQLQDLSNFGTPKETTEKSEPQKPQGKSTSKENAKLAGLNARNQHKKDMKTKAQQIATNFWNQDKYVRMGEMAKKVFAVMVVTYSKDELPKTPETMKKWITTPETPQEARKRGRPPKAK